MWTAPLLTSISMFSTLFKLSRFPLRSFFHPAACSPALLIMLATALAPTGRVPLETVSFSPAPAIVSSMASVETCIFSA